MTKYSTLLAAIALAALACTGPTGPRGRPGPPGMTGAQGPTGATGSQGQPGRVASSRVSAEGWVSLRDILFDFDHTDIRASEMNKISEVAAYASQNPSVRLGIDGSTDLSGGAHRNDADLSDRRIASVRDALIRSGVSKDRIELGRSGVKRVACNDSLDQCSTRGGRVEVMGRSE
jgi:peptidoglycan-associated lipoprotein